ncbi:hypothetical protein IPMB12_09035 [Zophobihabitans entericus]|uniref:Uncharacterized protein n=1 Tax=Zophobihabitans entericus TaxID=1635327 RepID=A0A6G9IF70_9GAMM|nr:hypothetical protein IPMB12_09035 [Zophobihabitans entericus]
MIEASNQHSRISLAYDELGQLKEGLPYHGSKYAGTKKAAFEKAEKAYAGMTEKGYLKIPGTKNAIVENITLSDAIKYIKNITRRNTYLWTSF